MRAEQPPPHLPKKIAQREAQNAYARDNYTYRQTVTVEEFNDRGSDAGTYRDVRDVVFSKEKGRYEEEPGKQAEHTYAASS